MAPRPGDEDRGRFRKDLGLMFRTLEEGTWSIVDCCIQLSGVHDVKQCGLWRNVI